MTAQQPDLFIYKGKEYSLIGVDGRELFDPADYNIQPTMVSTACYRGYVCTYSISEDYLVLKNLQIRTDKPREINKKKPEKGKTGFSHEYSNLDLKIDFTGSLLIGKGFIQEMYVHMGFQRPISFETVRELYFEKGQLKEEKNLSKLMAKKRQDDPHKDSQPDYQSGEDTRSWIEKAFSLDFDLKNEKD
ncbi:MAG: hypothetical protein GF308_07135 [Candidatus Heimdallarchaeota archaeon]|nr:hypothetical protein [Candidatus Heimdallarchaeota archaeon]